MSSEIKIGREAIKKHLGGLSWPTVYRLYQEQDLPLVRLRGQWALHDSKLKEWWDKEYGRQHTT